MESIVYNIYLKRRYDFVLENLPKSNPVTMLDIGCGNGNQTLRFAFGLPLKSHVIALDINRYPSWTEIEKKARIDFVVADGNFLPFPDDSFSVVTMTEVLEHVDNDVAYLRSLNRKMKRGGILIVTTPNGARVTGILSKIRMFSKKVLKRKLHPMDHRREYSLWELRKVLCKGGFNLDVCFYVSFCPYLPIFKKANQKQALKLFSFFNSMFGGNISLWFLRWGIVGVSHSV